ncbi:MAG: TolC family protein, partial [Acidobacteriota bacterium]
IVVNYSETYYISIMNLIDLTRVYALVMAICSLATFAYAQTANQPSQTSNSQLKDRVQQLPPVAIDLPKASEYLDMANGSSFEELFARTLTNNKEIEAARQGVEQALGLLQQAGARPNPVLDGDIEFNRQEVGENRFSIGIEQTFEMGGKRDRRIKVARLGVEIAEQVLADRQRQLRGELRNAFAEALAAAYTLAANERLMDFNREAFQIIDVRFREGDASALERNLALVEINLLSSQRLNLYSRLVTSILRLKQLAGLSMDEPLRLRGDLNVATLELSYTGARLAAFNTRPDLKAAQLAVDQAEANIELAKAAATPNIKGSISFIRERERFDLFGFKDSGMRSPITDTDQSIEFKISVPLPLFDRNRGNLRAALAARAEAVARQATLERAIEQEIANIYLRYETIQRTRELFQFGILPQSEVNLQIIREAYNLGQVNFTDVIAQQRRLIEAQVNSANAALEYYRVLADLEKAIGMPILKDQK